MSLDPDFQRPQDIVVPSPQDLERPIHKSRHTMELFPALIEWLELATIFSSALLPLDMTRETQPKENRVVSTLILQMSSDIKLHNISTCSLTTFGDLLRIIILTDLQRLVFGSKLSFLVPCPTTQ